MKKLLFILVSILLTLSLSAQSISMSGASKGISKGNDQFSGFQATFSFDQIESVTITGTERGTFSVLTIEGALPAGEFGTPQLPVFRKMIQIPVDATPKVLIKNFTMTEYNLNEYGIHKIYPRQPSVRKDQDINDILFVYDEKTYNRDDYNQSNLAEVKILGTMRGVIIGVVDVNPVQYNPVSHTIMVYNNIEIEVVFENANRHKTEEILVGTFSPYFKDIYKVLFNNGVTKDLFDDYPDLYSAPVHMLVIADRMFETTLQPWLEWKTKKGFYMDVNYTDVIGTTATAIKTFCHNKYNQGIGNGTAPTFIVIVGDTPQVPASQTGASSAKATDLYYAKVNTDGTYFPDMYYSRMSAETTQQLTNIIEKILYYEQYQFADPTYLDNVLLIAGADGTWNPVAGQPQINYATTHYYNAANGYATIHKYFNSYSPAVNDFNNVGFANYTAHCGESEWSWNGSSGYTKSQIAAQTNLNKYYVAMGNCCLAADFGWTNPYDANDKECFGETMIRAEKKGAVGYIGSSPSSYWHDDLHFSVGAYNVPFGPGQPANPTLANTKDGCYDLMFRDADFNTLCSHVFAGNLSVTYAMTNTGYSTDMTPRYYWEAYNVLGDGSLMPYNGQAAVNEVSHMSVIYIGLPTYEVEAAPGSYVAISKDGELLGTAIANESGLAVVTLSSPIASGGDVDIVVTRNQYKPYMTQVPAVAQEGAYIVTAGYTVPNEDILTYISNNTGIEVTLKNVGIESTNALTVTISSDDSQLTINNNTATCSGIAPDETATVNFNVTVANDIPDNKNFSVNVTITEDGKGSWAPKMTLKAYAPVFTLEKVLVNGVDGGNLPKGEVATITTVVKNKGGADAYEVQGSLDIHSNYITLACEEPDRAGQDLPAGESMELSFIVITDPEMPYGHEADIDLLLSAQYGRTGTESLKVSNSGSATYCSNGSQDCSDGDKFTSVILYKTSEPSVLLINNQNGTCASGGYQDFSNISFPLEPGQQYTIKVKTGYSNNQVRGWFDMNSNNTFDANEQLISLTCSSANVEATQNFTIPSDFAPGTSRFRLVTKYSSAPAACANSSYGQTHDYTILLPELYPRVQNVEAVLTTKTIITVTWDAPEEGTPTGFNIYRNGNKLNTTLHTVTTFIEENITEGVYAYNVTAVYEGNKESFSQMSNIICNFIPCLKPVDVEAVPEIQSVKITWNDDEEMEGTLLGYNIQRNGITINEILITDKEYLDENLISGTYIYKVNAKYEHCESDWTEPVEVIIDPIYCDKPENPSVTLEDDDAVITWDIPEQIDGIFSGYNIYRDSEKLNEELITKELYRDENIEGATYSYQISAVYEHCESEWTDPVVVNSIHNYQESLYSIFPNPTNGNVTIEGAGLNRVEIYDIQGRQLAEYKVCEILQINVNKYENGIYFVRLYSENSVVVVKRLVVIK